MYLFVTTRNLFFAANFRKLRQHGYPLAPNFTGHAQTRHVCAWAWCLMGLVPRFERQQAVRKQAFISADSMRALGHCGKEQGIIQGDTHALLVL
jgi:hypothetical protein